jgi:hypothetical protein
MSGARDEGPIAYLAGRVEELEQALRVTADELDRWGWGDMRFGERPQERRVVEAVARVSAKWRRFKWWFTPKRDGGRWRRAYAIDKLPGMCWSDLVDWAMQGRRPRDERIRLRDCRVDDVCRGDFDVMESCYCGKVKRTGPPPIQSGSEQ